MRLARADMKPQQTDKKDEKKDFRSEKRFQMRRNISDLIVSKVSDDQQYSLSITYAGLGFEHLG